MLYVKQYKYKFVYIHLIPHSHDDLGWLKTINQYYYGQNNSIYFAGVQYVFDSVVYSLIQNKSRKFSQVEIGFFYMWWEQQDENTQNAVKQLVKNKQFDFINGGWCMNDEATAYYEDIIDQMTIGHQFLLETFNITPTIGWQIDPFGHSQTQASLFSQMGINAQFMARIDSNDKEKRKKEKTLEMVWHPKLAQGEQLDNYLFTHVFEMHYGPPPGFCFDVICADSPIIDDPNTKYYNIEKKANEFVEYFQKYSRAYRSQHILHTFGDDFQYQNTHIIYKNLEKLVNYINSHQDKLQAKVLISSPSEYIEAIHQEKILFPTYHHDFFPYMDFNQAYWTGYFTSRPGLKGYIRDLGRYLQSTRSLISLLLINSKSQFLQLNRQKLDQYLANFEQVVGVNQHHDAITGTSKQHVADNYMSLLYIKTVEFNQEIMFPILKEQTQQIINEQLDYFTCNWNSTASDCEQLYKQLMNNKNILLTIYNPDITQQRIIRVQIPKVKIDIFDQNDNLLENEIICSNLSDPNDCNMYFNANLQQFSLTIFKLHPNNYSTTSKILQGHELLMNEISYTVKLFDGAILTISSLHSIFEYSNCQQSDSVNCTNDIFEISYNYYQSYQKDGQKSGVYIFKPSFRQLEQPISYSRIQRKIVYSGNILIVVQLKGQKTDTSLKFYNAEFFENVIEIDSFIDSISIEDGIGKEVVLDIDTFIENNEKFYTDSNGLEMIERINNKRKSWAFSREEPIASNYYPVNSMIQIQDSNSNKQYTLLNDRPQGGSSLFPGRIELMIHRRCLLDDGRGQGEMLNETEQDGKGLRVKLRHFLILGNNQNLKNLPRRLQKALDFSPLLYFSNIISHTMKDFSENTNQIKSYSFLPKDFSLKENAEFLKLYFKPSSIYQDKFIFRLHNMNEFESSTFSGNFQEIEEMTLTANQKKSDWQLKQLSWNQTNRYYNQKQQINATPIFNNSNFCI